MNTFQEIETGLFLRPLPDLIAKLSYSRRLKRAWQLVESEYDDPALNLERAARVSGISKNHLNVLLRQATGFTFHQLLIRYRLSRAITIMTTNNYNILETALQSGFGSLSAFERNAVALLGSSPLHIRKGRDFLLKNRDFQRD